MYYSCNTFTKILSGIYECYVVDLTHKGAPKQCDCW